MASGNFFNGTYTRRPRVAARVDDFGLIPISAGPTRTVALIGPATGGAPKVPLLFASPSEAARVLRGGDLLTAVRRCFAPSTEVNGASLVMALRVNPATQAALTLLDGSAGNSVVLTSINYGLEDNQIKVKVETGTNQGKKVTVARGSEFVTRDDLYRSSFSIQYVGAGSACTMTISATTLTTSVTGGPGSENLSVDLAVYDTVQKLVDFIDAKAAYTAAVVTQNPTEGTAAKLDVVTAVDIKTSLYSVLATLDAIVAWFNSAQQQWVTAARGASGLVPANVAYTYLAGGAEGSTVNNDWQACFDAIQQREVAFIVPVSPTASIHAMGDTHCVLMSADGKRPRRQFVGAAAGEYVTNLTTHLNRAKALNADRTALIAQGVGGFDDVTGAAITWPPYIAAAIPAGMQSGVPEIGDPITMKAIRATGLEWTPSAGEIELAMAGGLLLFELAENRGFYRVVRGISTWLKNDAYHRVEISTGIALDEVIRRVVDALEIFLGQKANPVAVYRIASRTQTTLKSLEAQQIIVGDSVHPAWRDLVVKLEGDTALVEFACSPVLPLNFINVTIHAETFTATIQVSVDEG